MPRCFVHLLCILSGMFLLSIEYVEEYSLHTAHCQVMGMDAQLGLSLFLQELV